MKNVLLIRTVVKGESRDLFLKKALFAITTRDITWTCITAPLAQI